MARTFSITDGTTTIDLLDTAGFQAKSLGLKTMSVDANVPPSHLRYVETYSFYLYSTDQDDAASQLQSLFELLRKAHLYHTTSWQNVPVYLTAQTDRETNTRYALVYGVPSIGMDDVFSIPFATGDFLENFNVTILRGVWRSGAPGTAPAAKTLTKTDGSANITKAVVANEYGTSGFKFMYLSPPDGADTQHQYATDTPDTGIFLDSDGAASTDVQSKYMVIASTDPPHTVVFDIATAGTFTSPSITAVYYDGSAWKDTGSSDFSWYIENANSTDQITDAFLSTTDLHVLSWNAKSTDTGSVDLGEGSGAVYLVGLDFSTDFLTVDTLPAQSTDQIYIQQKPYIELSSDILKGDIPSLVEMRMFAPYGQTDSDATFGAISKIIMGAKTDPGNFESHLNAGGTGLPSTDWTVSYDTDTTGNGASSNADVRSPGGYYANCTFGATALTPRVSFIGDGLLNAYRGVYKGYLRAEQVGGTDGDISVALQIRIGSTDAASPARPGETVDLSTYDNGYEIVDLGEFSIPFVDVADTDTLETDVIFEVQAERNAGTATLKIADLVLIPVDEWSFVLDDPVSDDDKGSSAFRGNRRLDMDSGILDNRVVMNVKDGTSYVPAENWFYGGRPFAIEPGKQTRIYFLMGHYSSLGWGKEPIVSTIAQSVVVELRAQALYLSLRGSD